MNEVDSDFVSIYVSFVKDKVDLDIVSVCVILFLSYVTETIRVQVPIEIDAQSGSHLHSIMISFLSF